MLIQLLNTLSSEFNMISYKSQKAMIFQKSDAQ